MLNKIVELTEEAQLRKPKLQRWLDQFGENYSKAVIILSAAIALIGPAIFKWPFFSTPGKVMSLLYAWSVLYMQCSLYLSEMSLLRLG